MDWDSHFQTFSASRGASFGADSIDDVIGIDGVIGAPGVTVTTSPTPPTPWDFSVVPMWLIWLLGGFGVLAVGSGLYHLGEVLEADRHARHYTKGVVKVSHVRRKPNVRRTKEWALEQALARTPSNPNYSAVTKREVI